MTITPAHDPALIAQQPAISTTKVHPQALEMLLMYFSQDLQLLSEARTLIAPHHFDEEEKVLKIAYDAMCRSQDECNGITYESLAEFCTQLLEQGLYTLSENQSDLLFRHDSYGLLYSICNPSFEVNQTNQNLARNVLQRFARERTVFAPLRKVLHPRNVGVPDLDRVLDAVNNQQARLTSLNELPIVNITPEVGTELVPAFQFKSTGVSFIDEKINGQRVGDCNGLLGPTGGGKTTMGLHMAVATAKQCWLDAMENDTEPEVVVFFTYEESAEKIRPRAWSSAFQITRNKLETLTSWDQLTQPGHLADYELRAQIDQEHKLSEIERYRAMSPQLAQCLLVVDMSGSDRFPNAGNGYVPEMVSILARINRKIRAVYVDYAGLVCERHMQSAGLDENSYRHLLKTFGDRVRKDVSEQFTCTSWVLHQLKGSTGVVSPAKLIHHSDAGESKDFATNMAVCMCLGVEDKLTGCRYLNISKCRYKPNETITPTILKIHSDFAEMVDVTNVYQLAPSNRFVTNEEISQLQVHSQTVATEQAGPLRPVGTPREDAG